MNHVEQASQIMDAMHEYAFKHEDGTVLGWPVRLIKGGEVWHEGLVDFFQLYTRESSGNLIFDGNILYYSEDQLYMCSFHGPVGDSFEVQPIDPDQRIVDRLVESHEFLVNRTPEEEEAAWEETMEQLKKLATEGLTT